MSPRTIANRVKRNEAHNKDLQQHTQEHSDSDHEGDVPVAVPEEDAEDGDYPFVVDDAAKEAEAKEEFDEELIVESIYDNTAMRDLDKFANIATVLRGTGDNNAVLAVAGIALPCFSEARTWCVTRKSISKSKAFCHALNPYTKHHENNTRLAAKHMARALQTIWRQGGKCKSCTVDDLLASQIEQPPPKKQRPNELRQLRVEATSESSE